MIGRTPFVVILIPPVLAPKQSTSITVSITTVGPPITGTVTFVILSEQPLLSVTTTL